LTREHIEKLGRLNSESNTKIANLSLECHTKVSEA
jgi:hypothetical protein